MTIIRMLYCGHNIWFTGRIFNSAKVIVRNIFSRLSFVQLSGIKDPAKKKVVYFSLKSELHWIPDYFLQNMSTINLLRELQSSLLRKALGYLTAPSLAKLLIAANNHEVRVNLTNSLKNLEIVGDRPVDTEYQLPVVVRISGIMIRWMILHGLRANSIHFVVEDSPHSLFNRRSYSDDTMLRNYIDYCPTLRALFADQGTSLQLYEAIANLKDLQYMSAFYTHDKLVAKKFLHNCQQLKYARISGSGFESPASNKI